MSRTENLVNELRRIAETGEIPEWAYVVYPISSQCTGRVLMNYTTQEFCRACIKRLSEAKPQPKNDPELHELHDVWKGGRE